MNESPTVVLKVAVIGEMVCIKIAGRANFSNSLDFKKMVQELAFRGYSHFILDLSDCIIMDSTFLGVLAGIGLKFAEEGRGPQSRVEIFNPNARIADLLENLGVADLFTITAVQDWQKARFEEVGACEKGKLDLVRNCLEAHQILMELNPENVQKFKDVTQFFAEDLRRMENNS